MMPKVRFVFSASMPSSAAPRRRGETQAEKQSRRPPDIAGREFLRVNDHRREGEEIASPMAIE